MKVFLVVAYVSFLGDPSITLHEQPTWAECNRVAKIMYQQVKAGTVRAWCVRHYKS